MSGAAGGGLASAALFRFSSQLPPDDRDEVTRFPQRKCAHALQEDSRTSAKLAAIKTQTSPAPRTPVANPIESRSTKREMETVLRRWTSRCRRAPWRARAPL